MRALFVYILTLFLLGCSGAGKKQAGGRALLFTISLEPNIYEKSDYGEPPQFAIWLENKKTGGIQTVFVTYRTATGNFEGKAECPVSLPAWIGAFRKETGRDDIPSLKNPAPEAITGPTPKVKTFSVDVQIPEESSWYYYIEMNVSGDYTPDFPRLKSDGWFDFQGNGQPSIIYRGEITGTPGEKSRPKLIGRTEQMYLSTAINEDLTGIVNAKEVFSMIKVECINKGG
jgi:hypothetical protein